METKFIIEAVSWEDIFNGAPSTSSVKEFDKNLNCITGFGVKGFIDMADITKIGQFTFYKLGWWVIVHDNAGGTYKLVIQKVMGKSISFNLLSEEKERLSKILLSDSVIAVPQWNMAGGMLFEEMPVWKYYGPESGKLLGKWVLCSLISALDSAPYSPIIVATPFVDKKALDKYLSTEYKKR